MKYLLLSLISFSFVHSTLLIAQTFEGLLDLKGHGQEVYYSPGHETRAKEIASRCDKAVAYL